MFSRNGICYDLSISDYRVEVDGVTYVFSSMLHLKKFQDRHKEHRDIVNYSLSKRFNVPVNVSILADIVLYRKIETRGFLVLKDGKELWQEEVKFVGGTLIQRSSKG